MGDVPFVLRNAVQFTVATELVEKQLSVTEDPLPASLDVDTTGRVWCRGTRVTDVHRETTDDN